jgi:hypothetical protein
MAPLLIERLNTAVAPAEIRRLRCVTGTRERV